MINSKQIPTNTVGKYIISDIIDTVHVSYKGIRNNNKVHTYYICATYIIYTKYHQKQIHSIIIIIIIYMYDWIHE